MNNNYIEDFAYNKIKTKLKYFLKCGILGHEKLFDIKGANSELLKLEYTSINTSRDISTGEEEMARISILNNLIDKLGYSKSDIELEKTYSLGRTKNDKDKRLDINLKYQNSENSYAIIEVKQHDEFNFQSDKDIEGQLFNIAAIQQTKQYNENQCNQEVKYLVYCSSKFEEQNGSIVSDTPQYVVIDYTKLKNYSVWAKSNFAHTTVFPECYQNTISAIKCGDDLLIMDEKEISKLKKQIHDKLYARGGVADNVIFTTIVNVFLSKLHDENVRKQGEEYQCQSKFNEDIEAFKEKINKLYREALVDKLGIDVNANNAEKYQITEFAKIKIEQIVFLVQCLQKYDLTKTISNANYDVLGDFFESISRDQFKQNKGQFFTHQKIVDFIIDMCNLDSLAEKFIDQTSKIPVVADLSAGSGTFLISAMKKISKKLQELKTKSSALNKKNRDLLDKWAAGEKPNEWAKDFIYGTEKDIDLGTAIKVNMILHGDGQAHIGVGSIRGDGLIQLENFKDNLNICESTKKSSDNYSKETLPKFDVIVSNPPFSVTLDEQTKKQISNTFLINEKENSENLFLERYYQTLNEGGRIGVVLPESVFDGESNKEIRKFLLKYFNIKGVISLPEEVFKPFATVKTSILFLEKRNSPINDFHEISSKINELTIQLNELNNRSTTPAEKLILIEKIGELKSAKDEKTFFYEIENTGYKRRKNKPEIIYKNSDLVRLVNDFMDLNISLWDNTLNKTPLKYFGNLVSYEDLLKERTYRMDYKYHSVFSFKSESEKLKMSDLISINDDEKMGAEAASQLFDKLSNDEITEISYCEIGNIDNSGFISSKNVIKKSMTKTN